MCCTWLGTQWRKLILQVLMFSTGNMWKLCWMSNSSVKLLSILIKELSQHLWRFMHLWIRSLLNLRRFKCKMWRSTISDMLDFSNGFWIHANFERLISKFVGRISQIDMRKWRRKPQSLKLGRLIKQRSFKKHMTLQKILRISMKKNGWKNMRRNHLFLLCQNQWRKK